MGQNLLSYDGQLATTAGTVITTGSADQALILKASAYNADTVSHTVTLYRVPSGGTAGATNILLGAYPLGAGETVVLPISGQAIIGGASLQALASAASEVNLSLSWTQSP
jgi:hypothetical protein